jgi:tetratricopeptide (TPR) repeat protein
MQRSSLPRLLCVSLILAVLGGPFGPASLAEAREPKRAPPKTKKVDAVSKKVADMLNAANEDINEEKYAPALQKLNGILAMGEDKLNKHEQALVHQSLGFVYAQQEKYRPAIASFNKAIALKSLPDGTQLNLQYNLGQLYLITEQYDQGIATLLDWFQKAENPGAPAYFMLANAYAQKEDYKKSLEWADQGLERMDQPKEAWIRLVVQLRLQLKRYKAALPALKQLVTLFPKDTYWMQLAAIYGELNQNQNSLVALEMAGWQGYLDTGREKERLAQMYMFQEIPYYAGKYLEPHLENGAIESKRQNWELLGNAWTLSQEAERALPALKRAAELSDDGKTYLRLGQLHLDGERWKSAESDLRKAIDKGGLKQNSGQARLLLGIALYNQGKLNSAKAQFIRAKKFDKTTKPASQWIRVIESDIAVQLAQQQSDEAEAARQAAEAAAEAEAEAEAEAAQDEAEQEATESEPEEAAGE